MVQESRAPTSTARRPLDLNIPLNLQTDGKSAPEMVNKDGEDRIVFQLLTKKNLTALSMVNKDGEDRIVFQLLTKKNMKSSTRAIAVPVDSAIASSSLQADDEAAKEQAEMKRKVLGYQSETELAKFNASQARSKGT
ncbi:hypothetical protein T484DRAFT_1787014 [Baffinella frigidus]|nr:hypothetical protein T484DRAFT_1787014 [Cryptophyta sp. CCMP2293]